MAFAARPSTRSALLLLAACVASVRAAQGNDSSNSNNSTSTIIASLILNLVIFAVEMTAFFILRPKFPKVYQPKSYLGLHEERVAALPKSLFGWIPQYLKTPTSEILYKNGLDAYQFVAFLEMMIWMFAPVFVFTWIFLMPLYAANVTSVGNSGFLMFTYGSIGPTRSEQLRLIGVLFANWIIVFYWLWVIRRFVASFVKNRQDFLTNPAHSVTPQARTILITGIPNNYLSERKLTQMYDILPGGVAKVWLNRDLKELPDLFNDRLNACNKLEAAVAKIQKVAFKKIKKGKVEQQHAGDADTELNLGMLDKYLTKKERPTHKLGALGCYGEKVDTLEWCREEIPRLTKELDQRRHAAETDFETYRPSSAAFILFNTQIAAHMAAKIHAHHEPYRMANHYLEAHPLDVIWENLSMNPYAVKIRTAIGWAITIVLVLLWTAVTFIIGLISNVKGTTTEIPFLGFINSIPDEVVGIIQGILPTVLLAVANILLVMFLRFLGRFSGIPTRTGVELSLFDRMAIFNLVQNFLILTIISGVSSGIGKIVPIIEDPTSLPMLLAQKIPAASNFFLSFVILQGLTGCASGFLQIVGLILYYVKLYLLSSTPRKFWHINNDMPSVAWGTLFSATTLLTMIGIGYTVLAPIMNGFAMAAFILLFLMYKYNFTYVYNMSGASETAGLFFPKAVNFVFAAMYLEMIVQCVLFFVSQDTNGNQSAIPEGVFMVVLLVIVIGFHYLFLDSYGDLFHALPLSLVDHDALARKTTAVATPPSEKKHHDISQGQSSQVQQQQYGGDIKERGSALAAAPAIRGGAESDRDATYEQTKSNNGTHVGDEDAAAGANYNGQEDPMLAFTPIPLKAGQREIWIADDTLGLGRAENERNRASGILTTMRGAKRDEKAKFHTNVDCPPGEVLH